MKWAHTWIGLSAGLVIAVVSLTGSVIVFRSEIPLASFRRSAGVAATVSLDEMSKQIGQAKADARVRRVRFPAAAGDPFVVQVVSAGKQEKLVCEASTGRVLGALNTGFTDWTIDLHRNLLAGKTGRKTVGGFGIVLFILAATGMSLWLIGARKWRAWISIWSQGGSRRFHFVLHRATGLWSYGLLTVVAFTGMGLAYPDHLSQYPAEFDRQSPREEGAAHRPARPASASVPR